jgi:DNA polymerase I-like protein with 3'-5' exonuclease and polymerase domains
MAHSKPNLAQIPSIEEYRACFVVPPGHKLVGIDASGLELRMLAHYMNDEDYTNLILNGDIHTYNQNAAGLPTRDNAKTFIYAFLYGAGDAKIGAITGGGAKAGAELKARFLSSLPALNALIRKVAHIAANKGHLPALDGGRIHVRHAHAALNTLLQGAGAVVMKQALVLASEDLKRRNIPYKLVAQVHDEFQVEVHEAFAQEVGESFRRGIIQAGVRLNLRCPLDGEFKIGNNWAETH